MRALLSVSDKRGIVEFARDLVTLGYEIISTGGTLKALQEASIPALEVSSYTQSPELFGGRVKTLHPKIHGGILYRRECAQDVQEAEDFGIKPITLVCVNLYPFYETTKRTQNFDEIIENIDIGGPSMVRAAAKAYKDVLVITTPDDYASTIEVLKTKQNTLAFRQEMMIKAFSHTAQYDAMIANYMNARFCDGFGKQMFITANKVFQTRYGENPHQKGALYAFDDFWNNQFVIIKGEPSFNNLTDINSAVRLATSFGSACAVSIVKHGNPCGFAMKESLLESYCAALACDRVSAYGGAVAVNGQVDKTLALEINKTFIEVLVAGDITQEALEVFAPKKRLKIFLTKQKNTSELFLPNDCFDFKHISGGFVYQQSDSVGDDEVQKAVCKSTKTATLSQKIDLEIAYKIAALTKSNCVAYVKDRALVAIGMGMTSRVDASRAALAKAKDMGLDTKGCVLASEAFFPFRDSIDLAAESGVCAVIQPGGSLRDEEVIQSAYEHNIALYFSGVRHFLH